MSKITEVTVGFTYTANIGNYESTKIHHSITSTIDEHEDVNAVRQELFDDVMNFVLDKVDEVKST